MIRVHCFVSCLCESVKRVDGADQRPFYFGVWDAAFFVTPDHRLAYHSPEVDQSFFCEWFERLYGAKIQKWYDEGLDKHANVERLLKVLSARPPSRKVLVMLDLFRLPERENKFNQDPFPHYVMLETTEDPDTWLMQDPDFRWEGRLPKEKILRAIESPSVAGGYYFDEAAIRPASDSAARAFFERCILKDENPFTSAVRRIVKAHVEGRDGVTLGALSPALREIPVLAIRKYAYEHGFAFFWRALELDHDEFLRLCDDVDELVRDYKTIQFRAMKLSMTGDLELLPGIEALLDRQDERELRIKARLCEAFELWCRRPEDQRPAPDVDAAAVQP